MVTVDQTIFELARQSKPSMFVLNHSSCYHIRMLDSQRFPELRLICALEGIGHCYADQVQRSLS